LLTPRAWLAAASAALFAALTATVAYVGYLWMFTGFGPYDDEGFMLVALRGYNSGHALYDQVSVQYGPFFFELFSVVGALGVPFDNDSGRLVTLAVWLAMALISGIAVFAFTRNLALGLSTQLIAFGAAVTLTNEPMHPGGLILLMLTGIAAVALIGAGRWTGPWPFAVMGALAAATILTKVNVGGFAAISIGFACVLTFPRLAGNWPLRLIAAAAFTAVPFVLMKAELDQVWVQRYAAHVALSAAALVIVTSASRPDPHRRLVELGWLLAGGTGLTVVVLAIAIFTGSSPSGLLHGIVLNPLQQAGSFALPLTLPGSTLAWDAVGIGGAMLWAVYRLAVRRPWIAIEGGVRVLVGFFIWLTLLGGLHVPGLFQLISLNNRLVLPVAVAWVVAAPRGGPSGFEKLDFARALVPALAILQTLHAYPVAGSQQAFSALMLVSVGAICIGDGLAQLSHLGLAPVHLQVATGLLFLTMAVSWLPPALSQSRAGYAADVALGLPGAARIHVPADEAAQLAQVTQMLKDRCDTFISLPGLDSFYTFAQLQPPRAGPTRWLWLSNDAQQQQAVIAASSRVNRLCVLENQDLINFWLQGHPLANGPLVDYIQQGFVQVDAVGPYALLVRR
jgi:hypothetical protein